MQGIWHNFENVHHNKKWYCATLWNAAVIYHTELLTYCLTGRQTHLEQCYWSLATVDYHQRVLVILPVDFSPIFNQNRVLIMKFRHHNNDFMNHLKHTRAHTHTGLMALFPGLPGKAGTRKVKPIWILLKQETVTGSGISWAMCKSASHSRPCQYPTTRFLQAGFPFLPPNQQRQSTEGKYHFKVGYVYGRWLALTT